MTAFKDRNFGQLVESVDERLRLKDKGKVHVTDLEQCSLFVDSDPIKRAMNDAAEYIKKVVEAL